MIVIETPRLILRRPTLGDADAIQAAKEAVWPDLQLWMSWAYDTQKDIEATKVFIQSEDSNDLPLIGLCRETQQFVVSTGLHYRHGQYETGYWVAQDFLGRGYATEATNAVLRYAFGAQNVDAVHISHFGGNEKSKRVIDKLGFVPTRTNEKTHERCSDGVLLDEHWYVLRDAAPLPELSVQWRQSP